MGVSVKLITVIGNDNLGSTLLDKLQEMEIDINHIYRHPGKRSCRKVLVNGEMAFEEGFSLEDYQKAIDAKEWVAFNSEWLVVEPQFQELVYKKMLSKDEDKLPYFCTCRHVIVPEEIPVFLHRYYALVLGVDNSQDLDFYLDRTIKLINKGTQNCILTDGNSRLLYITKQGITDFPLLPNQCFDIREGLPVLLAGLIYGLSCGYPLRQAVRIGIGTVSANESKKY